MTLILQFTSKITKVSELSDKNSIDIKEDSSGFCYVLIRQKSLEDHNLDIISLDREVHRLTLWSHFYVQG